MLIVAAVVSAGCGGASIRSANELIDRHVEALGGMEQVKAVRSRTSIGTYEEPRFKEIHRFDKQRPNFVRVTADYDPETGSFGYSEGFDGAAWEYAGGVPKRVTGMPATALRHAAEFDPPFIDYASKGHDPQLVGRTTLLGRDVYQLRIGESDYFFDAETFMYVMQSSVRPLHGEGRADEIITVFSDFRPVAGVPHAHKVVQQRATGEVLATLQWDEVRGNEDIPIEWFNPPLSRAQLAFEEARQVALEGDIRQLAGEHDEYRRLTQMESDRRVEQELNTLGYELLSHERHDRAIAVFRLALTLFPESANLYDSLGEAYLLAGDEEQALQNYRRSLELNPDNEHAAKVIADLAG